MATALTAAALVASPAGVSQAKPTSGPIATDKILPTGHWGNAKPVSLLGLKSIRRPLVLTPIAANEQSLQSLTRSFNRIC